MVYTKTNRSGSVLPLVTVSITLFFLMLVLIMNLGSVYLARNELQNVGDAASLSGASQLPDEGYLTGAEDQTDDLSASRDSAMLFASRNTAAGRSILLDRNDANDLTGGILVGRIEDPLDMDCAFQTDEVTEYNSVRVEAVLSDAINGPLELFFGAVTGHDTVEVKAQSTATIDDRILGFTLNEDETLPMLPFSVHKDYWDQAFAEYQSSQTPIEMYPNDPEAPGNFGSVDIGLSDNSTADLIDQILNGISEADLEVIGGLILTDEDGDGIYTKDLQGDTGVSAAVKNAFADILGEKRLLPIHRSVVNPGNSATYEICGFVGVQVVDVDMTGALEDRAVSVTPCIVTVRQAVVSPAAPRSHLVYALSLTR